MKRSSILKKFQKEEGEEKEADKAAASACKPV